MSAPEFRMETVNWEVDAMLNAAKNLGYYLEIGNLSPEQLNEVETKLAEVADLLGSIIEGKVDTESLKEVQRGLEKEEGQQNLTVFS